MKYYALIGNNLNHSFSLSYFEKKFKQENITHTMYLNIHMDNLNKIKEHIKKYKLLGFNVTTPFKEEIITNQ